MNADFRATARELQAAGKTLEAAHTLARGGDVEAAAKLLFRERHYADAGRVLLAAIGAPPEQYSSLSPEQRRQAERAASYFARGGDDRSAASVFAALGDEAQAARYAERARSHQVAQQPRVSATTWNNTNAHAEELVRRGEYEAAAQIYVKLGDRGAIERVAPALPARTAATALSLVGSFYRAAQRCLEADDKLTAYECLMRVPTSDQEYPDACRLVVTLVWPLQFSDERLMQFLAPWAHHPWPPMDDLELLYQVAMLRAKIGHTETARELLARILEVSPAYDEAKRALRTIGNGATVDQQQEPTIDRVLSDSFERPARTRLEQLELRSDALQPDTKVGDRYRLVKRLGRGGMAVVFEAIDEELNERVALKFLLPLADKAAVQRFKREIAMNRKLVHPNIVRVFELGMYEDLRYVTMELLSGEDLASRKRRPMETEVVVDILLQVARGVQEAHAQGIVHRDIKPANIFITTTGVVKVMDFGIAREGNAKGLTQVGHVMGTPRYMAPEHFVGEAGPAADLYSIGVTAYEVLCGRPPFDDPEPLPLMWKHARELPYPPAKHNRAVPDVLNRLVLKLLEKRPEDRPNSAAAVADELQRIHNWLVLNAPTIQEEDLLFSDEL